jgi:hypothetical protein
MSAEQYKKTAITTEPVLGSAKTTTYTTVQQPYATTIHEPVDYKPPTTTYHQVHPTGFHQEPTNLHPVTEVCKKWSEEASIVGSDVREGLGKYKDIRPATGATSLDQTTNVGPVLESGHTDASVYRPHDMTDTATKVGSDQREGLGTASKGTVEKDTKHHHKHDHDKHLHKHEHEATTYGTSPAATTFVHPTTKPGEVVPVMTTTKHADVFPATTATTTKHMYPVESKTISTGYTTSSATSFHTDTSDTPISTHYKYDSTDNVPHYSSNQSRDYISPSRAGCFEETATKVGSDQREGLGTGAGPGTTHIDTATHKTSGWSDTASKVGSDIREGLGSAK